MGLGLIALGLGACFDPVDPPNIDQADAADATAGTEDSGDGDGESSSDGEGDEPPSIEELCPNYCELIGDHCQAEFEQFAGRTICEATCVLMAPGEPGDVLGNSVACRTHHALLAAESANPHCLHAGPTGDTTCGGPCENFCGLGQRACPGPLSPFVDVDACIAECEGWDPQPAYFATVPDSDTYACRMHHLTLAALQPDVHCGHIGTESPVCRDPG